MSHTSSLFCCALIRNLLLHINSRWQPQWLQYFEIVGVLKGLTTHVIFIFSALSGLYKHKKAMQFTENQA
jgi:hypothetical protein